MSYRKDPIFGFEVPETCEGVPSEILEPANTWGSREEYYRKYDALAARFIENFKVLAPGCPAGTGCPRPEATERSAGQGLKPALSNERD